MLDAPLSNGIHINGNSNPDSPAVDSPATPVDNTPAVDVKIDVDYIDHESDARHEPVSIKVDKAEDASVLPQVGTPADPATIPIEPPKGTPPPPTGELLEDVRMAEEVLPTKDSDVHMADGDAQSPSINGLPNGQNLESLAAMSTSLHAVSSSDTAIDSLAASSPYLNNTTPNEHERDDDDKPPPAKRARKYSDADKASLANTGTPPPATPSEVETAQTVQPAQPLPQQGPSTLSTAQWRFCSSTIRTLKKMKDSAPFLHPVDPVALNILHYPSIIKHPMDFSTIDRKIQSSNPSKPDPNAANPRYHNADEFIADVRLVFSNCLTFNGAEHPIVAMGKRVEAVFDKQIKQMPPPEEPKPVVKKPATPPPPPPPPKKVAPVRRPSTSVPVIRRSDDPVGRPKREIHPPPPKDLPYSDAPKKTRKAKVPKNETFADQFKFCEKVLKDLHRKHHYNIAHPFYEPVDWLKLDIPHYPKIIKKPMDLSTIRRKLQDGEYATPDKFRDDFKLMIRNSLTFNPPKNPVHEAGKEFDRLFDEKWKNLPPLRSNDMTDDEDDEDDEDEDDSEDERARMIANMESQIQTMKSSLDVLKKKGKVEKKEKKKEKKTAAPVASTSKATAKQPKATATGRKKGKKPVTDDDVLSFEQKKDLSDTIGKLDGVKLEKVIQIIHEGVPEIRDSTEEIELEIDQLPSQVLTKLYNFVIRPMRTTAAKRSRTGKGTGTGGLKRKSMDEDVEAAKIRALEARMKLFEEGGPASMGVSDAMAADDSEHSSAESSSESSASDSE